MYLDERGLARFWSLIKGKLDGLMLWEQTAKAGSVTFYAAPGSPMEVEVFFSCEVDTPSGAVSSSNPLEISGKSGVSIQHGEEFVEQPFGMTAYGGSFSFATGVLTVTHAAVEPDASTVDISDHPADVSSLDIIDSWGREVELDESGETLTISGDSDGGLIVYRLATPETYALVSTGINAPARSEHMDGLQDDTVSTSDGEVQVTYGSPAGRAATDAEIDAICASPLAGVPVASLMGVELTEAVREQLASLVGGLQVATVMPDEATDAEIDALFE